MVAISLYRGNLHRVSDLPRRWPFPSRKLSLRNFKLLIRKRSLALARLLEQAEAKKGEEGEKEGVDGAEKGEGVGENGSERLDVREVKEEKEEEGKGEGDPERERDEVKAEAAGQLEGKSVVDCASVAEVTESPNISVDEKKKELEKKLHSLNEKKHVLVQMLKQILNAEEEIKRRNLQPPSGTRASIPVLSDPTLDLSSATRYTSKSADENFSGDLAVESEDVANANVHPRHLNSLHSPSPSAASPVGRSISGPFQRNLALHTPRGSSITTGHGQTSTNVMGNAAGSPSRFGPNAHQSHATSQLSVSVPGSQFVASSPSLAASGGASSSRDSRLTSPPRN